MLEALNQSAKAGEPVTDRRLGAGADGEEEQWRFCCGNGGGNPGGTAGLKVRRAAEVEDVDPLHGGGEVFAACRIGEDGRVAEVLVVARGTKSSVAALSAYLERGDVISFMAAGGGGFGKPVDAGDGR